MEYSKSFADLAAMIEKHWGMLRVSDFNYLLHRLQEAEHITGAEHESLLELLVIRYSNITEAEKIVETVDSP